MFPTKFFAASACLLISLGCHESSNTADQSEAKPKDLNSLNENSTTELKFSSPEACWAAMLDAKKNANRFGVIQCLVVKDRAALIGLLAYETERHIIFNTPLRNQASELLNAHGLAEIDIMGALQVADSPGGVGTYKVLSEVGLKITDPVNFAKKASDLVASAPSDPVNPAQTLPSTKFVSVELNGDRAVATITVDENTDKVLFVLEDGSWRISNDRTE